MIKTTISQYDSSTLVSASYSYEHKTLLVQFKHGTYLYKDVTAEDFETFNSAKSQGKALNEVIKGTYEFDKITEDITNLHTI